MPEKGWWTVDDEYGVIVQDECWQSMVQECASAGEMETGGILIGYYTPDKATAVVTKAVGPPVDSERGHTWFRRGIAGLSAVLRRLWDQPRRTYYVGEWHYHPAARVEPSPDDLEQMVKISRASNYQCKEPIMLVIGNAVDGRRPIRAFVFPAGSAPREMKLAEVLGQE